MPYADPTKRAAARQESDRRRGRKIIAINLDAKTAALWAAAVKKHGGSLAALRALLETKKPPY